MPSYFLHDFGHDLYKLNYFTHKKQLQRNKITFALY